jgi:hypothetical protein
MGAAESGEGAQAAGARVQGVRQQRDRFEAGDVRCGVDGRDANRVLGDAVGRALALGEAPCLANGDGGQPAADALTRLVVDVDVDVGVAQ